MKHFSELSRRQIKAMCDACIDSAVNYAKEIGMSGLSQSGSHDIYNAIESAIESEWLIAQHAKKTREEE